MSLHEAQIRRYSRQILLRDVGGRGQRKLLQSAVSLVGLAPVGVSCALYLATAGIGRLILYDDKLVSVEDIGAGGLYLQEDVGRDRALVVSGRLKGINPDVLAERGQG